MLEIPGMPGTVVAGGGVGVVSSDAATGRLLQADTASIAAARVAARWKGLMVSVSVAVPMGAGLDA